MVPAIGLCIASTTRSPAGVKMSSESSSPFTGTLPGGGRKYGEPEVSPGTASKGRTATWSRMVVNHGTAPTARSKRVQPLATAALSTARTSARLDTAHLLRARRAHDLLGGGDLRRPAHRDDAELVVAEARVVAGGAAQLGEPRVEEHPRHRGQRADQDRALEADDDVGRQRHDRLATDDDLPVERRPDRVQEAEEAPR